MVGNYELDYYHMHPLDDYYNYAVSYVRHDRTGLDREFTEIYSSKLGFLRLASRNVLDYRAT
jgi:hypothetical protein